MSHKSNPQWTVADACCYTVHGSINDAGVLAEKHREQVAVRMCVNHRAFSQPPTRMVRGMRTHVCFRVFAGFA